MSVDAKQRFVFVANYATGNIVSYKILADGALSDSICTRQHVSSLDNSGAGKAWAHQVMPLGNDLFSADKGGDRIYGYHIENDTLLRLAIFFLRKYLYKKLVLAFA